MIRFPETIQVYISCEPIDFRRGLDGLLGLITSTFGQEPQASYLFLFCNKHRTKIKAVCWDANGFILLYKRVEVGKFQFPKNAKDKLVLNRFQLECLLSGMHFIPTVPSNPKHYTVFS